MSFFRASCIFIALAFVLMATSVRAQSTDSMAAQIAEFERKIVQYETAFKSAPPDKVQGMQYLVALATLSTLYVKADRIQDSWPLSEKMLSRAEKMFGSDSVFIVTQLEALASVYGLQGRYGEAETLRKRAIAINKKAFGSSSANVAISLQGMANLFRLQDRYDDALVFATRALAIAEKKLPAGDPQRAVFISQVADIHMSARRFELAEPLLKQALTIIEKSAAANPASGLQLIQILQSIGLAHHGRGENMQARPYIDRAIGKSIALFGPSHTMTGAMLMTLALQLFDQGQLDEAERLYQQALPISEKNGKLRSTLADNYAGLGLVEFKRKNWRKAYTMLLEGSSIAVGLEQIAGAGTVTSAERGRVAMGADIYLINAVAAYRTAEAEPGDRAALQDEAFRLAQRAERSQTASVMAQMAARVSVGNGPLGTLVRERQDLAREWQGLDKRMETALVREASQRDQAGEAAIRARMAVISARLTKIDAQIGTDFPDLAKLSDPAPLSIREVQALLKPHEVMIFVANRLNQSLVWAISRDAVAWELVQVGTEELTSEVTALRCGLDEAAWHGEGGGTCAAATGRKWSSGAILPFDLERAHKLYATLLGPFAGMMQGAHLIVAASGPLALLPLHVLVTEPPALAVPADARGYARAGWLAKRNAISVLPSVASFKTLRASTKASRAPRPFIGIANPLFAGPDGRYEDLARLAKANRTCAATIKNAIAVASRGPVLLRALSPVPVADGLVPAGIIRMQAPLPETADEVCTVGRSLGAGETDIYLAERASEALIKQMSASGELAKYQIVHFATHGALAGQISRTAEPGLLLSPPANGTALDDGYLSASEIATLRLDADWVILSACNTAGAGHAGAEALSGIARAFFYAQARAVLASHWEVASGATVKLITLAATAIGNERTIGRAEALRRAMVSLIDDPASTSAHPKSWAPFVLAGEGGRGF